MSKGGLAKRKEQGIDGQGFRDLQAGEKIVERELLHFSDIHGKLAVENAVLRTAAAYPNAVIAITGDIYETAKPRARHLNYATDLRDHLVFLVRGNHDQSADAWFGHFSRNVCWNAPYLEPISECSGLMLGLDFDRPIQAQLAAYRRRRTDIDTLFVLHHVLDAFNPYKTVENSVVEWAKSWFPNLLTLVLLRGHTHKTAQNRTQKGRPNVIDSVVWSADPNCPGCANRFLIRPGKGVQMYGLVRASER